MQVRKSITQRLSPSTDLLKIMESFRQMCNDCIRIGLAFEETDGHTPSTKKLSLLCDGELKRYDGYSGYRLTAISKAAGILSARRKSIKRGYPTSNPYFTKPLLVDCYGFKIEDGELRVHIDADRFEYIPLNSHTLQVLLSDATLRIRSFTLTERSLSLCVSKEVRELEAKDVACTMGIDRNLRNLTVGNSEKVTYYDMSKTVEIAENTKEITGSFKRNDARIRKGISFKYGERRRNRTRQIIHRVTKQVVTEAKENKQAIVFEDIGGIRKLYQRGNGQGSNYRSRMNSWPFHEVKRQIEYKAAWEGVPVVTLTKRETRGTTMRCPRCGERLQSASWGDAEHYRELWCEVCKGWMDRDLVAVLNISRRGWLRFGQSHDEGEASEAMRGNAEHDGEPLILRVDASKLGRRLDG